MRLLPALLVSAVLMAALPTSQVSAASPMEVERMTAYATLLGRALGCGFDIAKGSSRVTAWLDKTFPPGTPDQRQYLSRFAEIMRTEAERQSKGTTAVTCTKVGQMTKSMGW